MNILNPHIDGKKRRVAIYIRVSTQEQKIEGYSLEAQKTKLLSYVNNNLALNLTTKEEWIFTDTHTGSDVNRIALNELRKQIKEKKFDAVLVWKIDRLSRSLKHLLILFDEFKSNEVSFISVQENIDFKGPIGSLIFQIFGAIAQFERELIKGRTTMGKIASAEMGNFTGNAVPYGYKSVPNVGGKGKRLEIIPKEKVWVEKMYEWYIYNELGFEGIAKKLNELKVPRGESSRTQNKFAKWTEKIIRPIIQNPLYRGEFVANRKDENGVLLPEDQWTVVSIPPCVSEFTFQQAQQSRTSRKGGSHDTDYLLSGKMRDMTLSPSKPFVGCLRSNGGYSYRRKQFKTKDETHIPVFEVPARAIEDYVWEKILHAMRNPQAFIEEYLSEEYTNKDHIAQIERELNVLREQEINTEIAVDKTEKAYESGIYSEEKMQKKLTEYNTVLADIEIKIQDKQDQLALIGSIDIEVEKLKDASKQVQYRLENLSPKQKKVLCNLFVERIEMYRVPDGKKWKISAEIFFRFNPNKYPFVNEEGRTGTGLDDNKKESLSSQIGRIGATRRI